MKKKRDLEKEIDELKDGTGPAYECPASIKCYKELNNSNSAEVPCPLSKFWK